MRGCMKAAVAFGLVALMAGSASAQQGRGGGFGGGMGMGMGGHVNLLGNPGVQKELKLDEGQIEKATALMTETREKMMEIGSQLGDLQGPERFTKMRELAKPIQDEALKTAGAFLKPEQLKRLHQIEIQQRGPAGALADAEIAKKLKVTAEQETKVKAIMAEMQEGMNELRAAAGQDRQAMMQKFTALRKETNAKVVALMSEEQQKMWKEMTGEPFEVVFQPRQQRR